MTRRAFLITILTALFLLFSSVSVFGIWDSSEPPQILLIDDGHNLVYAPTVLPGSWKYFLKVWRDRLIDFVLFFDSFERHLFKLKLAHKRLLEAQELAEVGKCQSIEPLAFEYQGLMKKVFDYLEITKEKKGDSSHFSSHLFKSLPAQKQLVERIDFLCFGKESGKKNFTKFFDDYRKEAEAYWGLDQLRQFQQEMIKTR